MASLGMGFTLLAAKAAAQSHDGIGMTTAKVGGLRGRRPAVAIALATKGAAARAKEEEKGLFDWILGGLQKDEQLLETDPILNKAPDVSIKSKPTAAPAAPKSNGGGFGGLGGLFAKK